MYCPKRASFCRETHVGAVYGAVKNCQNEPQIWAKTICHKRLNAVIGNRCAANLAQPGLDSGPVEVDLPLVLFLQHLSLHSSRGGTKLWLPAQPHPLPNVVSQARPKCLDTYLPEASESKLP